MEVAAALEGPVVKIKSGPERNFQGLEWEPAA
jgi:hypothetical protein